VAQAPGDEAVKPDVIIHADPQKAERIIGAITLAFAADPANRWLFPEPDRYLRHFPAFVRALGGAAIPRRTALVSQDYCAVALWLAPGEGPDEGAMSQLIEVGVAPEKQGTIGAVIEQMGRYHPDEPHWYLPFIGVEPARQGKGLGAMLLQASLSTCDAAGQPAYLESTNPRNRPLYERHGFEAIGEIRVGDCPPIVPMLRRARPG